MSNNNLRVVLKEYEKEHIVEMLYKYNWNKPEAARVLGIGLSSLYRKIKELGIEK